MPSRLAPSSTHCAWSAKRSAVALLLVFSLVAGPSPVGAATYLWDANTGTTGVQDGAGTWSAAGTTWWNPATGTDVVITSTDTAFFGGGGVGGTINLSGNQTVAGLVFGQTTTTGYSLSAGVATTLTVGASGILMLPGAQAVTIGDSNLSLALSAAESWTNRSTNALNIGGAVNNGGFSLTLAGLTGVSGTGTINLQGAVTGSGGLTLTNGATVTLSASSGYSGATSIVNAGTLTLSGASGALSGTSGITLSNGTLTLTNAVGEQAVNRVADAATITSSGGTINWTNPSGDNTANWAETLGVLTLSKGATNIISTNAVNAARTEVLTLGTGSLTHAAGNTSTIAFGGASLGTSTTNNINVTGLATTAANQIIGPWATYGASAAAQTDYASYNRTAGTTNTRGIQAAGIAASAETTWTTAANSYTLSAATTLTATRTIASLRYSGAAATLTLGTSNFNLATYGILNGGSGTLTIANGTAGTGVITTPTGGDNTLFLIAGNAAITLGSSTVAANIADNGTAVNVVKSGSGVVTFGNSLAGSGANTYTGVTTINSGILTSGTAVTATFNGGVAGWLGASTAAASNLVLNGGTLRYSGPTAGTTDRLFTLGEAGGVIENSAASNGTLAFTGTGSIVAAGTGDRTLALNVNGTGGFTFAPVIVDPTGGGKTSLVINSTNTGAITLSGTNTFTGGITIQARSLIAGAAGALGNNVVYFGSGTSPLLSLRSGASTTFTGSLVVGNNSGTLQMGGLASGQGSLTQTFGGITIGTATLTFTQVNMTTNAGAGLTTGALSLTGDPTFTINNGTGTSTPLISFGALDDGGVARTVTVNGGAGSAGSGPRLTFSNAASVFTPGTKLIVDTSNTGAVRITTSNGFSDGTASHALIQFGAGGTGVLQLLNNAATTFNNDILFGDNSGQITVGGVSGVSSKTYTAGALSIGSATFTLATANGTTNNAHSLTLGATTFTGNSTFALNNISGTGSTSVGSLTLGALNDGGVTRTIIKNGLGTLVLGSAATSMTSGTTITAIGGTSAANSLVRIGNNNALGLATLNLGDGVGGAGQVSVNSGINVASSSTITYAGGYVTVGSAPISGPASGTGTISGTIRINANDTSISTTGWGHIMGGGGTLNIAGPIVTGGTNTANEVDIYSGNVGLNNAVGNTYTSLRVNQGTTTLGVSDAVPTGANVALAELGATTFALSTFNQTIASGATWTLGGSGPTLENNVAAITMGSGVLTLNGTIANNTGSLATQTIAGSISFGGTSGTFNIDSGHATSDMTVSAGLSNGSLIKTGAGILTLTGTKSLTNLAVNDGTVVGGYGTGGVQTISISSTGSLQMVNNLAETLTLSATPSALNVAGGARIGLELGAPGTSDRIAVGTGGTAATSGTITLDFYDLGGLAAGTYTLLTADSGLTTGGTTYNVGSAPLRFNYSINATDTLVQLTTTAYTPRFWTNSQGTGSWSTISAGPLTNWATDSAGTTNATDTPQSSHTVIFSATNAPLTSGTVSTTLDGVFAIDAIQFLAAPTGVTAVNIGVGSGGALTIAPATSSAGIYVQTNAGTATFAAGLPLTVGAAQTWNIVGGGANGSALVMAANVAFNNSVTKSGAGALTLSGTNTGSGTLTFSAGTINLNSAGALGSGGFIINGGTTLNNTSGGAVTLSANNPVTLNGNFTFTGTQNLSLGTGAISLPTNVSITSSAGNLTLGGAITESGGARSLTKLGAGALTLSGNNAFSGGLNLSTGTLNLGSAGALGTGILTITGGALDNTSGGSLTNANNNAQVWNGNFSFTGTSNYDLGTGDVSLGAAAGTTRTVTVNAGTLTVGGEISNGAVGTGFIKLGAGTLALSGASTHTGTTTINAGVLNLTGSLTGNGTAATGTTLTLGSVAGNAVMNIAGDISGYYSFTGGNITGANSAINMTSGTVSFTSTSAGDTVNLVNNAASGSYGSLSITGGTMNTVSRMQVSRGSGGGSVYIGGTGTLNAKGEWFMIAYGNAGAVGSLTIGPGGTMDRTGASNILGIYMTQANQYAVFNIAGGTFITTNRAVQFGNGNGGTNNVGFLNLAGGTFQTGTNVAQNIGTSTGQVSYINLAGATLKATAALSAAFPNTATGQTVVTTMFGPIDNTGTANDFTGGLKVDSNGFNVTLSNPIVAAADGGVTAANLTITGGSGYIGAPVVQFTGGTLSAGGTPASGYAVVSNGVVTDIVITSPGTYTVAPTVTLVGGGGTGASVTVGALTANTAGGITKLGAGTLILSSSANTFTGPVIISGGIVQSSGANTLANIGVISALGKGDATSNATNAASLVLDGGTYSMTNNAAAVTTDRLFTVTQNGGTISQDQTTSGNIISFTNTGSIAYTGSGARTLTLGGLNPVAGTNVFAPLITNAGSDPVTLNKTGISAWLVTNTGNSYTGGTTINQGVLVFDSGALGSTGNITYTGNSTLRWDTGTTDDLSSRLFITSGFSGTVDVGSNNVTFVNAVGTTGGTAGTLAKAGTGSLTLNTAAVHTGGTTLSAGTLNIGNAAALGTGTFTISGVSTIDNTTGSPLTLAGSPAMAWNANFTFAGTNDLNLGTGNVTLSAARTVTVTAGTLTVGGVIDDGASNFGFTKAGAGTLYLKGANTFGSNSAFTIQGGTVIVDSAAGLGDATNDVIFTTGPGTLRFTDNATFGNGQYFRATGVAATIEVDNGKLVDIQGGPTSSATNGVNTNGGTNGPGASIIKTGLGTLRISGGNGFFDGDGGWVVSQGTLSIAGNNTSVLGDGTPTTVALRLNGGTVSYDTDTTNIVNSVINTFLQASSTVVSNVASAGGGINQSLNVLTVQGNYTLNVNGGDNVTSGTAGITASTATLNGNVTFNITDPVNGGNTLLTVGAITGNANSVTLTGNGDFAQTGVYASTAATALTLGSTYSGVATLSQSNTYSGITEVDGGVLSFSASNQLGDASASNDIVLGNGTLRATNTGTVNLGANRQINLTTGTTGVIDVTSGTGIVQVTGGIATTGAANLTKTGLGTVTVTGALNLNGGNLSVQAGLMQAGLAASGISAVSVANGATLNLYDGATVTSAITGLALANGSALGFDLNAPGVNDILNLTGTPTIGSSVLLNFNNLGGLAVGTYDLINISSGSMNASNFALGTAPSGLNYSFTTANSDQTLRLTTSTLSLRYWQGDVSGSWSANTAGATNWATDLAGTTDLGALPVATDTLVFSTTYATGPTISTTLDGSFTVDSLQFKANPTGVTAVTIAQGTSGTLTLSPVSANNGIAVADNAGAITISAPIVAGANQSWEVIGTGANGSSLTVSGDVTFTGNVSKTGAGTLTLSGNNSGAGGFDLVAGTLNIKSATALGTGNFDVEAGTTFTNGTAGALTLTANNTQTWNGSFTFGGTQNLNLGTGAVTMGNNLTATFSNTLTVGGAIDDGTSSYSLTKAGTGTLVLNGANGYDGVTNLAAGTLTLAGDNSGASGGVTMAASTTLNINHAAALGTGTFTINGGTIDNSSAADITVSTNPAQTWASSFTFTGTRNLNLGTGTVTLAATPTITVSAGNLTVGGPVSGAFGITKAGAGTLTLAGLSTTPANNYLGTTTLDGGTTVFTAPASLTGALTFGSSSASTNTSTLDLSNADASFAGGLTVQSNTSSANSILIGAGKTLNITNSVSIGAAGTGTADKLTVSGAGTLNVSGTGLTFRVGGSSTALATNTLDMSGLAVFTTDLGSTGAFRIGSSETANNPADVSTVLLAATSTIKAGTLDVGGNTMHSSTNFLTLGSGVTTINANSVDIGSRETGTTARRASGSIAFASPTNGSVIIRAYDGTSAAALNLVNSLANTNTNLSADLLLAGHNADILGSTVTMASRPPAGTTTTTSSTATLTFDQGVFNTTTLVMSNRGGASVTTGATTANATFGGGTVTLGTVTMSQNSASTSNSTGSALSTLTFNGTGTNSITTLTMGSVTLSGATATGGSQATLNNAGSAVTTVGTLTMSSNAANAAVTTSTSATSAINVSGGSLTVTNDLVMSTTSQNANNSSSGTISITGGTLTVGGNITYTNGIGTESNTVTLDGGTLDMTNGDIGSAAAVVTFNAMSGTLKNLAHLNAGTTALTKTSTGTLTLENTVGFTNTYAGATIISAGTLQVGSGGTTGTLGVNTGSITDNGTLAVNHSDTYTIANVITGSGTFEQRGTGTTVLTGANNYSGTTTIAAGTLQLGNGGTTGTLGSNTGAITDNGTLAVNRSDTLTIANVITGSGGVSQRGTGTTVLTGVNDYTGATSVTNGTLQVGDAGSGSTGSSSTVTVNGVGAALAGSGTVNGNASIVSGALRPGDSAGAGIGTLTVSGNLSVNTGGTLEFKVVAADSPADAALVGYLSSNPSSTTKDYLDSLGTLPGSYTNHNGQNDFLSIGGALTMGSLGTVTLVNGITAQAQGDIFHLIDWATLTSRNNAAAFTGSFSSSPSDFVLPSLNAGLAWDVSAFKTYGIVSIVPEPSRAMLALAGLAFAMLRRRRR